MKMKIFNDGKSKERLPLIDRLEGVDHSGEEINHRCISFSRLLKKLSNFWNGVQNVSWKAWEMGRTDPRKIIFAMKMGLALSLVSLLIFWKESADIGQYSIWAILTVIVMFEFSIGCKSHSPSTHERISEFSHPFFPFDFHFLLQEQPLLKDLIAGWEHYVLEYLLLALLSYPCLQVHVKKW